VNVTATRTVSPGISAATNAIVSWRIDWGSVSAWSVTVMLSGAPPLPDDNVSHGVLSTAVHVSAAPSALANRNVSVRG